VYMASRDSFYLASLFGVLFFISVSCEMQVPKP